MLDSLCTTFVFLTDPSLSHGWLHRWWPRTYGQVYGEPRTVFDYLFSHRMDMTLQLLHRGDLLREPMAQIISSTSLPLFIFWLIIII